MRHLPLTYLTRSYPKLLLEHAGEILGILESQRIGDLSNGTAVQQHGFGLPHHKAADVLRSATTSFHTDQVPEIIRRKEELPCQVTDGGNTGFDMLPFSIITFQKNIYLVAEFFFGTAFPLELPLIEACSQFQQQRKVGYDDGL